MSGFFAEPAFERGSGYFTICVRAAETELTEQFPLHVVCDWIGNSAVIAAKHYLQVTDSHFSKAAGMKSDASVIAGSGVGGAKCGAPVSEKVAQNAA